MPDPVDGSRSLKRDPALVPLSRDHHFALMQALALRRAGEASLAAGRGAIPTAEAFLTFYHDELLGHMADEEEALLPLSAHVHPEDARRLVAEHEGIREQAALLRQALLDGQDPRRTLLELGDALHDHVRFEERVFFEEVQAGLSEEEMEAVGRAIDAHRQARGRGPGCSLPPPGLLPRP
jgi:hypothetical protein